MMSAAVIPLKRRGRPVSDESPDDLRDEIHALRQEAREAAAIAPLARYVYRRATSSGRRSLPRTRRAKGRRMRRYDDQAHKVLPLAYTPDRPLWESDVTRWTARDVVDAIFGGFLLIALFVLVALLVGLG